MQRRCPQRITNSIAYAAGTDAGNRRMRKAGRKKWSKEDYNVAVHEVNRIMSCRSK